MSRSELVRLSGVSKQQLSRLETGLIRLRLDHLKPFAGPLGYTPEQILLWGRYPGTTGATVRRHAEIPHDEPLGPAPGQVPELDPRARPRRRRSSSRIAQGRTPRRPAQERRLGVSRKFRARAVAYLAVTLLVLDTTGDSMAPTIVSGERVIVDTSHKTPTPDGLYAIRDTFNCIVVKRLQVLRSARPPRVKIISDNTNHPSEEAPLGELEIVGKVLCCLKLF